MINLKLRYFIVGGVCSLNTIFMFGQDSSGKSPLLISAYVELYYSFDMGRPADHLRPGCFYSFNRHNELNVNLGFIQCAYNKAGVRGAIGLMTGTYAQYNLSDEPAIFRNLLQANAGVRISRKKNIWLDAGIIPSHIGFESAVGKESNVLTRSLLAENSPYYECGAKLSFITENDRLEFSVLVLNGWQRIQRVAGNNTPAFGTQTVYKTKKNFTFNWSTFVGNEFPDSAQQWRFFNNFFAIIQVNKFGFVAGFDIGFEQAAKNTPAVNSWYSPVVIMHYRLNSKNRIALRGEYYSDEKQVIIKTGTSHGFQTAAYSINYDYSPEDNILIRFEARGLNSKDKVFRLDNQPSAQNFFFTGAVAFSF